MESLERLPNITRLSERVLRILGQNPGKFTLQGTNTYLIGKGKSRLLLDTGEGRPEYLDVFKAALENELPADTVIDRVVCSHWHHDHVGGVKDIHTFLASRNIQMGNPPSTTAAKALSGVDKHSALGPRIFKYPCPEHDDDDDEDTRFEPLKDMEEIKVDESTTLLTLHTPGHTSDHLSFFLKEEKILFTADCVLGQGTAVFEDLSSYIRSLERQIRLTEELAIDNFAIFPGHGPVIEDGVGKIREYIQHRLEREKQIMQVLLSKDPQASSPSSTSSPSAAAATAPGNVNNDPAVTSAKTARQIVEVIYAAYPVTIHDAAEHQVLLHLQKLLRDGKVTRTTDENIRKVQWQVTVPMSSL
ncbi:hypothetical protein DFQ27_005489 [Actinomortierella ambigua]|uniref:Metallo-beta-lactamase domain-containing protein n=1 Tax=Actinomortierella ambigua TaxID=1343610 RepID=A0A9P6U1S5_9FUNG|nr:hypothetical protein DFQ27_005489 [Actinomortierella ambigua]